MTETGAWVSDYVGRKWDETDNHCWAFCRYVWRRHFGWQVPEFDMNALDLRRTRQLFETSGEFGNWRQVSTPAEGDAVIMAQGRRPCHVGIWVNPGRILHSVKGIGSVCIAATRLRDQGYRATGYYRRIL